MWDSLKVEVVFLYGFEAVEGHVVVRLGERALGLMTGRTYDSHMI